MDRKIFGAAAVLIVIVMVLLIIRTERRGPSDESIRTALLSYLSQRSGLNMSAMDVDIKRITREGDRAEAQVEFRAKQGEARMEMTYRFERQGNSWVVQGSSGTAGSGHPAIPEAAPPGGAGELPPGHPAVPPVHGTGNPPAQPPSSAPHPQP